MIFKNKMCTIVVIDILQDSDSDTPTPTVPIVQPPKAFRAGHQINSKRGAAGSKQFAGVTNSDK